MKINKIHLIMENVEVYTIEQEDVKSIILEGIQEWLIVNSVGDLVLEKTANKVLIRLNNKNYKSNFQLKDSEITGIFSDRIKNHRDIACIRIFYFNSSGIPDNYSCCVDYQEENIAQLGSPNKNMSCHIDEEFGEIIIEIWNDENIK